MKIYFIALERKWLYLNNNLRKVYQVDTQRNVVDVDLKNWEYVARYCSIGL